MSYSAVRPAYSGGGIFMPSQGLGQAPALSEEIYETRYHPEREAAEGGPLPVTHIKDEYKPAVGALLATMGVSKVEAVDWTGVPVVIASAWTPLAENEISGAEWVAEEYAAGKGIAVWLNLEAVRRGEADEAFADILTTDAANWPSMLVRMKRSPDNEAVLFEPKSIAPLPPGPDPIPPPPVPGAGPTKKAITPWHYAAVGAVVLSVGAISAAMYAKGRARR